MLKQSISNNKNISLVLLCHFISATSTLGIAPFFSLILSDGFQQQPSMLIGFLYVLPTLLTALSAPFWGKIADKINKKSALLRAQFGLSISFFIASLSKDHFALFVISLCLQGLLGGTLAAANAYLAKTSSKQKLSSLLNLTQLSARCAFLIAPMLIGLLISFHSVFLIYTLLGIVTLFSTILIMRYLDNDLPKTKQNIVGTPTIQKKQVNNLSLKKNTYPCLPYTLLLLGNFILSLSLVASFPYFILLVEQKLHISNPTLAGFLFGLPHAMYLLFLFPCQRLYTEIKQPLYILTFSLISLALSFLWQAFTSHLELLIGLRIIMGFSMTLAYISLNSMTAQLSFAQREGQVFAWLDSFNKYGGVAAGILAGLLFAHFGVSAPLILSALVLVIFCVFYHFYLLFSQRSILNASRSSHE